MRNRTIKEVDVKAFCYYKDENYSENKCLGGLMLKDENNEYIVATTCMFNDKRIKKMHYNSVLKKIPKRSILAKMAAFYNKEDVSSLVDTKIFITITSKNSAVIVCNDKLISEFKTNN